MSELKIPDDLRGDWEAWKQHRTARFDIKQLMDAGVQFIERIARVEAERDALKAQVERGLGVSGH